MVNDKGAAIGKKDQHGDFHPYKRRGRAPKNLAQKQTGFASPDAGAAAASSGKKGKTNIELEDMLAAEAINKEATVADEPASSEHDGTQS